MAFSEVQSGLLTSMKVHARLSEMGRPEQAAQDHVHVAAEHLQGDPIILWAFCVRGQLLA